ncbi:MAG: UDP-N-acetylmuramoyl-tripeptide--D-alanyl-D-alanine ligase [Microthrixaceae bacterium]
MDLRCAELAEAVGGRLVGADVIVRGASIDSRSVAPGQLFVPIVAERDGHHFIRTALEAGAAAYFTAREPVGGSAIVVADTGVALRDAGRHSRETLDVPVVGITGSVGKTSVKDLLAGVLSTRLTTASSTRSFNNELGVPLTLLNAAPHTEIVVVEMGARDRGHIDQLCAIARPTIGIVTRVAAVHTEVFGTIEDVAVAKAELVRALPPSGTAVLNAADARVAAMSSQTEAEVVMFGAGGDVEAHAVTLDESLRARFRLRSRWGDAEVALAVRGRHQVENALAAAAAAFVCGLSVEEVAAALATATLSPWRMELTRASGGALVLNDAYNANPTSTLAALESLAALPADRRIAVLGVMAELGAESNTAHAAVAAEAARLGVRVVAVAARQYGAEDVDSVEEAVELLGPLGAGDAVLVKGSRVAGLERLAELLLS